MSRYTASHEHPDGPGDDRPTAIKIVQDEGLLKLPNRLSSDVVVLTGGTSGLGLEAAKALHATGAKIIITGRCSSSQGQAIASEIANSNAAVDSEVAKAGSKTSSNSVAFVQLDLSDLDMVGPAAKEILSISDNKVKVLICNAGIMAPQELKRTKQDHELQFGVNFLAHFLLVHHLTPALLATASVEEPSKVIMLGSNAHRGAPPSKDGDHDFVEAEYNPLQAYSQSKSAEIYLANELDRRFREKHLRGLSVHPGVIMETGLPRHMTDDGQKLGDSFNEKSPQFWKYAKSAPQGAASIVWAATSEEVRNKGGLYLEDCGIGQPARTDLTEDEWYMPGRAEWCYDEAAEAKLWADAERMLAPYF